MEPSNPSSSRGHNPAPAHQVSPTPPTSSAQATTDDRQPATIIPGESHTTQVSLGKAAFIDARQRLFSALNPPRGRADNHRVLTAVKAVLACKGGIEFMKGLGSGASKVDEIFISGDPTKSSDAAQLIGRALFEIAPVQSIDIFSAHLDSEISSLSSNASECIYKAVLNLNNCPEHPVINRIVSEHLAIFKRQIAKGGNKAVSKPVFPLLCLARFCPDDVKHQVVEALNAFIKSNPPAEIGQLAFLALLNIGGTRAHGCLEKIPAHPGWEQKLNDDASCIKIFGQTILENYLNEGVASQVLLDGLNAKESASKAKPSTHLQLCLENHSLKSLTTGFSSAQLQSLASSLFLAPAKYGKALSRLFQLSTFSCQQPVSTWSGFTFRLLTGIKRSKPVTHNPLEEELADRLKEAEAQARKPAAIDRPNLLSELEEEGWRLPFYPPILLQSICWR